MRALIIAAGSGIRLGSFIDTPKSLLVINGKTILERQIEVFKKNGIDDIIVLTGPNYQKFTLKNVKYIRDENYLEHDVLCSLMSAKNYLNDEVIVSYSDILYDEKIIKELKSFTTDIGIAIDKKWLKHYEGRTDHPITEAENVLIRNNKIFQIKKNISKEYPDDVVVEFLGLMKMSKNGCSIFLKNFYQLEKFHDGSFHSAPSLKKAYLTDMIQELIETKIIVEPISVTGVWCEIDTVQDLENAKQIFN